VILLSRTVSIRIKVHGKPELEISFRVMILSIKFGNDGKMTDINPEGNYNEDVNMGNVNNGVDKNNAEKLSSQSIRTPMGELVIKSFGDTVFKNILDKDPGKDKVHEKPEERGVVVNINPKGKYDEEKIAAEHDLQHSAWEDRFDEDTVRNGDDEDEGKIVEKHLYKKPEKRVTK
jgi:hypothetical protein